MFGDLDWPLNASRGFVSISWAACFIVMDFQVQDWAGSLSKVNQFYPSFHRPSSSSSSSSSLSTSIPTSERHARCSLLSTPLGADVCHWRACRSLSPPFVDRSVMTATRCPLPLHSFGTAGPLSPVVVLRWVSEIGRPRRSDWCLIPIASDEWRLLSSVHRRINHYADEAAV